MDDPQNLAKSEYISSKNLANSEKTSTITVDAPGVLSRNTMGHSTSDVHAQNAVRLLPHQIKELHDNKNMKSKS